MTTDIREICDLSDEDRETRRASLHKRLFVFVRRRQELPDGLALYFDETPEMRAELDEFVEYERGWIQQTARGRPVLALPARGRDRIDWPRYQLPWGLTQILERRNSSRGGGLQGIQLCQTLGVHRRSAACEWLAPLTHVVQRPRSSTPNSMVMSPF